MRTKAQRNTTTAGLWGRSFIFIMLANALLFMAFEMLLPTLPLFISSIGGEARQIGLVTGIFMFSAILIRPLTGVLAQRIDKKYLLIAGISICMLATGSYYLSSDIYVILLIRFIHGAGFGLASTYFATIAAENIPRERRGEGIGYFGVGETVAISVGPLIGVALLELYSFRGIFMSGAAILLLSLLMALFVSRQPQGTGTRESVKVKLFERRVLFPSLLILLMGLAAGSIMSFVAIYAVEKGFQNVAWFFFTIAAASFLVRLVSGALLDRLGPGYVLIPSALLTMAGLLVLTLSQSELQFIAAGVLYGFGFGAIFPAIQTWCLNLVDEHEHEGAMASFFNFFDLGIGGGSLLFGFIASAFSYTMVYYIGIGVMALFLLFYILFARRQNQGNPAERHKEAIID
ncbi:MFS transporter [Paenibacillus sp. MMS20-IR301]|uniref:MFS transporter n=1 Tax=Paenibacillus sp. MMS20-IR301 TaxID=2895946 RepID=UPI0037C5B2E2